MRQMMDLGAMLGLTPGPSWDDLAAMAPEKDEDFAPMAPEKDDDNDRPASDAGEPNPT